MTLPSLDTILGSEPALGFVETPRNIVDIMVDKLFRDSRPQRASKLLDPGCGTGAFIDGVVRWCRTYAVEIPTIVGIEGDPARASAATQRFRDVKEVEIRQGDFWHLNRIVLTL